MKPALFQLIEIYVYIRKVTNEREEINKRQLLLK